MDRKEEWSLNDLLKYCIKQSTSGGDVSKCKEMDPEKRSFLLNALKSMTVDVIEELSKAVGVLRSNSTTDEEKLCALNIIRNNIDHIDFANSFIKLGESKILMEYLQSPNTDLKVATINIIAEMSQNNTFCQNFFLQNHTLTVLTNYLRDDSTITATVLYAISSLVRSFEPGLAEFIKLNGIKLIDQCLKATCPRTFQKTCFLISTLSAEHALLRDGFVKLGSFSKLVELLESLTEFDFKTEAILSAMAELSKSKQLNVDDQMCDHLKTVLSKIIDCNQGLPENKEIVEYCESILDSLTQETIL